MTPMEAYEKSLADLPAGTGARNVKQLACHKWGLIAGLSKAQIIADIRQAWGDGRQPTDRELERAHAAAAIKACKPYDPTRIKPATPRRAPQVQARITRAAFDRLAGDPLSSAELAALSPLSVGNPGNRQRQIENARLLLQHLYHPGEFIFCGPQNGTSDNVLPVENWVERFRQGRTEPQFMINPLKGTWEPKTGEPGLTRRGKNCIADYRHTLFEIDKIDGKKVPLALQARFLWRRITEGWPIRAVIYSGGKSLHAIVQVNESAETWHANVEEGLFRAWADLGADDACKTPERQARLPGCAEEGRKLQSLLWLCPRGWTYSANQHAKLVIAQNEPLQNTEPAPEEEDPPPVDPDGFTPDQRQRLNLLKSVFGGQVIRIEKPEDATWASSDTTTATHHHGDQLRAVLDGLQELVTQTMEDSHHGGEYDETPAAYLRFHARQDTHRRTNV